MKADYASRLMSLREKMEPDATLLLRAPERKIRNRDVSYPYRNSSDLLYLTGISQPDMAIMITHTQIHIFAEEKSQEDIRWTGHALNASQIAHSMGLMGNFALYKYSELMTQFSQIVKNSTVLYHEFGENSEFDKVILEKLHELGMRGRKGETAPSTIKHTRTILHELRLCKDDSELFAMQKATEISAIAHNELMSFTRSKKDIITELECRAFLEAMFQKKGAEFTAYPSILAMGNNATVLHYENSYAQGRPHDLVLVDAGCEFGGYASDITRTFPLGGVFSQIQRDIYQLVLHAQKEAILQSKTGVSLDTIHASTVKILSQGLWDMGLFRKIPGNKEKSETDLVSPASLDEVIEKEYYRHYYMHKTSHFLGLDVHDVGIYYENGESRALKPGMVITVEPGLYFPDEYDFLPNDFKGIGIRIEDDIAITDSGNINLTQKAVKEIADIQNLEARYW